MRTFADRGPLLIGVMSGTSADAIDVAVVRVAAGRPRLQHYREQPMPEEVRKPVLRLGEPGLSEIDALGRLDRALGEVIAEAVLATLGEAGLHPGDIAAIGSHGQTVRHRPCGRHPFTLQIGSAAVIAEKTGITVVSDFRSRDMAAGGQGAPLAPFAHRRMFASDKENIAVLNIGGIANITWLGKNGETFGFDCGPGNMIMDALIREISNARQDYDKDGEMAASGRVCRPLMEELMRHPFVRKSPPKSTGREEFGSKITARIRDWPGIHPADRLATAAAFTVHCVVEAVRFLPAPPERWLVCGGGARNLHLLAELRKHLAPAPVSPTDVADLPAKAVEAVCFALLAHQTLLGATNILHAVTGARRDVCGGTITPADNWRRLLAEIPAWTR
jgi:Predicted molecular chaperone distantly related to HSP70-fold metalloproteases